MHETIFVLGLGETLKFFKDFDKPKIGVNDIWSRVETEMVVCVDDIFKFDAKRLAVIAGSKPTSFFTHLRAWEKYLKGRVVLFNIEPCGKSFEENKIYYSNNSTFVACSLAYTMGYKNIVLYGADFLNHPKLKGAHSLGKIAKDFEWLDLNFVERGVKMYVGHRASRLSEILPIWDPLKYSQPLPPHII